MKTLVYDCETTGLPVFSAPSEDPRQPYITQLSAILVDDAGAELGVLDSLVKPEGWIIGAEASQLTGITQEQLEAEGRPITEVLEEFWALYTQADAGVLAFNESFDARMVRIMLKRLGWGTRITMWEGRKAACAMARSTAHCNLPPTAKMKAAGFNKPKNPKLAEAYKILTGLEMDGAHNALFDVRATITVHQKLLVLGL